MTTTESPRAVEEAYLLALAQLVDHPFDPKSYRSKASLERQRLALLSETQIGEEICKPGHEDRLRRIRAADWVLDDVELESCSVWNGMGGDRERRMGWANGPVPRVVERLKARNDKRDRLWEMADFASVLSSETIIIVLRRKTNTSQFRIDDGSHRAVAFYLAGIRHVRAFVGTVPVKLNLDWRWEGGDVTCD